MIHVKNYLLKIHRVLLFASLVLPINSMASFWDVSDTLQGGKVVIVADANFDTVAISKLYPSAVNEQKDDSIIARLDSILSFMSRVENASKENDIQWWTNLSGIIGTVLSFLAILITIYFGWLTYKLTIKYGESEQKVLDLHKIISGIETQRSLTIENSKPRLKDTGLSVNKIENPNKYKLGITIKNFGYRPAHQIKMSWIFYKLNTSGEIESHGNMTSLSDTEYQNFLNPNEDWTHYATGYLAGGLQDLATVITTLELDYFDDQLNARFKYIYYYYFILHPSGVIEIETLETRRKILIDNYRVIKSLE